MQDAVLVLGASGAIGRFVLPRLAARGTAVLAASRRPLVASGVHWCALDLARDAPTVAPSFSAVLSTGPLDLAARWLAACPQAPQRVVAFSSTSAASKQASADPGERALAARLQHAESELQAWAAACGAALTILRPTLVYGAALDRNLSRLAALARRLGWIAIPRHATGLRQPVHADDLAAAAVAALALPRTSQPCYDLPGGETLPYRSMVARVLDTLTPRPRLLELPMPALRAALAAAHLAGRLPDLTTATLHRTRQDLVFDATPAARDLAWEPRPFTVTRDMLDA